ncbi:hypothetical protein OEA41_000697 [Lepraria neglecta]|uniref:C2H2-type domain-containing protein n=1 Tax=Lepraria neglecta TaxID=209136 RepID=A0AAD9ZGY5_9LECA|nr:hypothetical protein OEA41_000697 [Lepraria neglecta]
MAPFSLHSAIKLARLVQRVKDRLKSCIKKCLPSTKPAKSPCSNKLTTYARKTVSSTIESQSKSTPCLGRRHTLVSIQRRKGDITRSVDQSLGRDKHTDRDGTSLLDDLDLHAQPGDLDLRTVAAQDCLFIKHDSYLTSLPRSLNKLYDILGLTSALLDRLQNRSGSSIQRKRNGANDDVVCDDFKCDKYVANLEHLLRCLKQTALDAIIRHYLNIVEAHILHWHHYWQYQKRIDEGWFAEWPNGQRPLSTTWPWNVKPSLLVLWGVCWMFYGSSAYNNSNSRPTRNRRGTEPLGEDFWTRHSEPRLTQQLNATYNYPSQLRQQYVTTPNTSTISETSEAWAGPTSNTHPNFSWLHPQQAGSQARRANDPGHESHAHSRRSQEPPRNMEGMMYCDNPECADNPPVFSRKCEWSKHMDKHNRPYICEEPGCEKINGFTYSGGLSRHQREVHRQHGGPKASCHCPHKDCKRSTGVGFSRKENLHEHLRRVHRDAGAEQREEPETLLNETPSFVGTRKRRRPVADDVDERDEDGALQQEVKKLRRELQEKDDRLKRLEQVVAQLAKGQHK